MRRKYGRLACSVGFSLIVLAVIFLPSSLVAAPQQKLSVQVSSASCLSRGSDDGLYTVTGQVRNEGLTPANQVEVIGVFYDDFGHVLANQTSQLTNPPTIAPGLSATFTLTAICPACALIASYNMTATTQES